MDEQDVLALKKEVFFCHNKEIEETEASIEDRIQAAKLKAQNRSQKETPTSISEMEVGLGEGRATREIELIWWPHLYSSVEFGKLTIRFYIHKVNVAKM